MTAAFCAFFLFFSMAMGYAVWHEDPSLANQAVEQLVKTKFSDITAKMQNANWFGQIGIILANNLVATLLLVLTGGILPILPVLLGIIPNGMMIGLMAGYFEYQQVLAKSDFFLSLLPHGVFEIPAVLLSATVGLVWGTRNWRNLFRERTLTAFRAQAKESLSFLPLIIALLVVASITEVLVTPLLFLK